MWGLGKNLVRNFAQLRVLSVICDEDEKILKAQATRYPGLTLMKGHILEYHPAVTLLKDLILRKELGRILYIYSNRLNPGKVRQVENILWSFAPHDIAVICSVIGAAPVSVQATGARISNRVCTT